MEEFLTDVTTRRTLVRGEIERGPLSGDDPAGAERIVRVLNQTLAAELACVLRYKHHYFVAEQLHSTSLGEEFLEYASEEADHAEAIAARIEQLGGDADLTPATPAARSSWQLGWSKDLAEMIREDLEAERVVVSTYAEIIDWLAQADAVSRRMLEEILLSEEEHTEDMRDLLAGIA